MQDRIASIFYVKAVDVAADVFVLIQQIVYVQAQLPHLVFEEFFAQTHVYQKETGIEVCA